MWNISGRFDGTNDVQILVGKFAGKCMHTKLLPSCHTELKALILPTEGGIYILSGIHSILGSYILKRIYTVRVNTRITFSACGHFDRCGLKHDFFV